MPEAVDPSSRQHPSPVPREPDTAVDCARQKLAAWASTPRATQQVPLALARRRVLATPVLSPIDLPGLDNSAMDGFAFDGAALHPGRSLKLRCVGTALAGRPWAGSALDLDCVRIMTGAVMPQGTDTVVPLEQCSVHGQDVHLSAGVVLRGANRRLRGEDLGRNQPALPAGRILRSAEMGLLAALGLAEVHVFERLRVALFSSGDELLVAGQPQRPGSSFDSNRCFLAAALEDLGMEVIDLGVVPDDEAALRPALQAATAGADVVLTSGGISAGDADRTRAVLADLGDIHFMKLAMRPGRPFAFGTLRAQRDGSNVTVPLIALPGNPVAAWISFQVLARPALLRMAGAETQDTPLLPVPLAHPLDKRAGRTELLRGRVERGADGRWQASALPDQGSAILRTLCQANALLVLHPEQTHLSAGDAVDVWLLDTLG
jgi:molybdopterin molybdotransferase